MLEPMIAVGEKLKRSFYDRPTLEVARDLLGQRIVFGQGKGRLSARIVETEAYIGQDDPACHAARGQTKRNQVMFGQPGFAYVYLIYGMYNCFNVVTEEKGFPAAVLIRAAEPEAGYEIMQTNSPRQSRETILRGPGKFCRSFGLTTEHSGLDLTGKTVFLNSGGESPKDIVATPRIGIKKGAELLYRFYRASSPSVSGQR